jgi:subtilase family serine protease
MRCDRATCKYFCHTNPKNNGGTHCCAGCKSNGNHGINCQKVTAPDLVITPRFKLCTQADVNPNLEPRIVPHASNRSWFTATEMATIYGFPSPGSQNIVIGVVSFGGGLYGTVTDGVLTDGDVQTYWSSLGIETNNQPKVIIVLVDGASNTPNINDNGATYENALDIETIGACYPSNKLTIILYLGTPTSTIASVMAAATTARTINGTVYRPSIVSCSWGLPEVNAPASYLDEANIIMSNAAAAGITICTATGDYGSNDGVGGTGNYVDFPSSSPNVTAVGGTTLLCKNNIYTTAPDTVETAWTSGGGGVSVKFPKPSWQSAITATGRSTPDICMNADPNTGVLYRINGANYILGGTSVSAPIAASFFALINLTTFANPLLYGIAAGSGCFHDIISGTNGGYNAAAGYDQCTGLGSINGANLKNFLNSSYTLTSLNMPLYIGVKYPLLQNPMPMNGMTFSWSSSKPAIAVVDSRGLVTPLTSGSAIITCTASGLGGSTSFPITVLTRVAVTGLAITGPGTSSRSSPVQLSVTYTPSAATNKSVVWSIASGLATVNVNGKVVASAKGKVIVRCSSQDTPSVSTTKTITFS